MKVIGQSFDQDLEQTPCSASRCRRERRQRRSGGEIEIDQGGLFEVLIDDCPMTFIWLPEVAHRLDVEAVAFLELPAARNLAVSGKGNSGAESERAPSSSGAASWRSPERESRRTRTGLLSPAGPRRSLSCHVSGQCKGRGAVPATCRFTCRSDRQSRQKNPRPLDSTLSPDLHE